ncbi:MAG: hypothetical protein PHQ86_09505 [Dehalococcoidales bacterium]|nr:hypothetical protein [Dehalococcoidales bacterium]
MKKGDNSAMLKKVMTRTGIITAITALLLFGVLSAGSVFASSPDNSSSNQAVVQAVEDDDAAEAELEGPDLDDVEEELEEENEDADAAEDDEDGVDNQVEQDGESEGDF